ncbi:MAG: VCBS repeat-containing protein [Verrucomicrobia bacterium]|nr:VCBS repeat-containing protein [Verrucomicrobiota bacterium]
MDDLETPPGALLVKATSSNQELVLDQNLFLGGTGTNRTMSIFPTANVRGEAIITVTVTDGDGASARTSFKYTVRCDTYRGSFVDDFNGDGQADILFQHTDGSLAVWFMNGNEDLLTSSFLNPTGVADPRWKIAATADLNGDHHTDLIFQHADGTVAAWLMNGINLVTATLLSPSDPGPGWRIVGAGDVNRDNHDDILFQHDDGSLAVWLMNGTNLVYAAYLNPTRPADPRWRVVGTGDFTQVGAVDLVFQHEDGTLAVWLMNGVDLVQGELLHPAAPFDKNWRVAGTVDLNRDGRTDLLFQHTDGSVGVWFMDGVKLERATLLNPSHPGDGWRIAGPK